MRRQALHMGEVMRIAQKLASPGMHAKFPEALRPHRPEPSMPVKAGRISAVVAITALAILAAATVIGMAPSRFRSDP